MDIDGVGVGAGIIAPDVVHELLAREDAAGERRHLVEQHEFLLRQHHALAVDGDAERVALHHRAADDLTALARHLGAAQQRAHAQYHFPDVDGLDHIVVAAGEKAEAHVVKGVLGGDHHNGDGRTALADRAHKLVAVHLRHHDVGDDEIVIALLERNKRLLAVGDAEDSVTVFGEHVGEELAQLAVILRNENFEQSDPSDPVSARRGFAALVSSVYHIFCKCAAGCAEILHGGKTAQKKSHPFG